MDAGRRPMSLLARTHASGSPWHRIKKVDVRIFFWLVSLSWLAVLAWQVSFHPEELSKHVPELLPWVLVISVAHLLPLTDWPHAYFTPDIPILVAGSLVLTPLQISVAIFLGAVDVKEFRGETTLSKALCNRSQLAWTVFLPSLGVHLVSESPSTSAFILPLAFFYLAVSNAVNYGLVGIAVALERHLSVSQVVRRMKVGGLSEFLLTFVVWGVLGAMLAVLYDQVPLALVAFLGLALLGRHTLSKSQMLMQTSRAYRSGQRAFAHLGNRIHEERTDERRLIAADLHDEVLQPLFKVSLMAHVLKADLENGRLLEMDKDLPELLAAVELSANTLRELIGDLRRSTLGRGGLAPALSSLVQGMRAQTTAQISANINSVKAEPQTELILYQIAKEAIGNAVSHARADAIWIELCQGVDGTRLMVRDDGVGFDPLIAKDGHFGMHIMKERAASVGSQFYVDTSPGEGCSVTLILPG
jgi:signal transduction histidine kinase